ncbi:Uncharacterized protein TCAP_04352 [Tolypocladium capitatum]|uniref:BRCT domain-containing protein n=1 Tax=Tolypocladium capitatum TaxID=45235 RepID=A0A2K3QDV3_9HYPO|nr:Uncharacterized protein TCAP_04352 [Tolypocladium capitatum]
MLARPGPMRASTERRREETAAEGVPGPVAARTELGRRHEQGGGATRKLFDGVVVYVNGSTYPLVSDHRLKHLLGEHGAHVSLHLSRRGVTHVILGRPAGGRTGAGAGLAGGKLEREIRRTGRCGVKFVGVEWVLESLRAGTRLPEARFAELHVAAKRQGSVYGLCSGHAAPGSAKTA